MNTIKEDIRDFLENDGYVIINQEESSIATVVSVEGEPSLTEYKTTIYSDDFLEQGEIGRKTRPLVSDIMKETPESEFDVPTIIEYLNWHMLGINENIIGREEIITQAIYAILTGEHMLLLSRTGMAKTYLANSIFNIFEGARIFASQASKDQTPDNYFGPYNIDEFRKGRIRHNIKGSIIEANLAFLDEFFDASDVVLRSLLSVLNERKFINGSEQIDAAVHTAIATANYMRLNEVTEAVLDRFTYKSIIPEDNNVYSQLRIDKIYTKQKGEPSEPDKKIYFNQIIFLHEIITNRHKSIKVVVPEFVSFMKNVFVNRFVGEMRKHDSNFFISPRKQAKLNDFLRAAALIKGRYTVNMDDLRELYLALCTLNSYVSLKNMDKSEKDLYIDVYQKTMSHFKANGAIAQVEFLINIRNIFQEIKEDPEKRDTILKKSTFLDSIKNLLKTLFTGRRDTEDEEFTIDSLKRSVFEVVSSVEEVNELKNGILKDYRELV